MFISIVIWSATPDVRNGEMEEMWHVFIQLLLINTCGRDYTNILPSISQLVAKAPLVGICNVCPFWAKAVKSHCASPSVAFLLQWQSRSHFEMVASHYRGLWVPKPLDGLLTTPIGLCVSKIGNLCCVKSLIFWDLLPQNSLILLWQQRPSKQAESIYSELAIGRELANVTHV